MALQRSLSVTTVTYFSELKLLRFLLVSLELAANELYKRTGIKVDYYLVDNSDDKQYFQDLQTFCSQFTDTEFFCVHLIQAPENLGYSGGNNLVLNQLKSDYHLILNPDVVMQPDALWRAVEYMACNESIAILSPQVVSNTGAISVVKTYPDCLTLALRYLGYPVLNRYFSVRLARYECAHLDGEVNCSVDLAGGCFIFLRTSLFKQLQGFDKWFFMYFEDYDLSLRARKFGEITYVPSVKITHAGGGVGRKDFKHHFYFSMSAIKFFTRHGWRLW